jgi:predicted dehydrogenase
MLFIGRWAPRCCQVDVVHVAVVNTAHRDTALAMVAGGKAVLVEKTFAMDEAQAAEVIAAARRQVRRHLAGICDGILPAAARSVATSAPGCRRQAA